MIKRQEISKNLTMIMVEQNARAALNWAERGYVLEPTNSEPVEQS